MAANSGIVNPGVINYKQGTPSWGQKLLDYQLRSEKCLEELESLAKHSGQSKVVPEEAPADRCTFLPRNRIGFNRNLIILF